MHKPKSKLVQFSTNFLKKYWLWILSVFIICLSVFEFFNLTTEVERQTIYLKFQSYFTPATQVESTKPPPVNKRPSRANIVFFVKPDQNSTVFSQTDSYFPGYFDIMLDWKPSVVLDQLKVHLEKSAFLNQNPEISPQFTLYFDSNNNKVFDAEDRLLKTTSLNAENDIHFADFGEHLDPLPKIILDKIIGGIEIRETYRFFIASSVADPGAFIHADFTILNNENQKRLFLNTDSNFDPEDWLTLKYVDESTFQYFERISENINVFLERHPFFVRHAEQEILLPAGDYQISETIIVPKNTLLTIQAGAHLKFAPNVSLLSYSPVQIIGTPEQPITFSSANPPEPWGVFGIIGHGDIAKSRVEYALFEHGGEAYINGIFMSGMLAAHYADIDIQNCKFQFAHGDDGLNVKYGQGTLSNSYFYQNDFDAVDFDFNLGNISDNYLLENGNDGLDLGGVTSVFVARNFIDHSGDKGISMGEHAEDITIVNNLIMNSVIGIAVKDLSEPRIINNTILNNQQGIAAYQKKEVFGGGFPTVKNTLLWGNETAVYLDKKSEIGISYCNIEGGYKGKNNLDLLPIFTDPDNADYTLSPEADSQLTEGGHRNPLDSKFTPEILPANPPIGIFTPIPAKIPF